MLEEREENLFDWSSMSKGVSSWIRFQTSEHGSVPGEGLWVLFKY